ncbi:UDP-N-acetylglucosamine--LPS N-acetylglucosamine transferase [soil metagenome]
MSAPSHSSGSAGPQNVLLVASSGGHLAQLLVLRPWWTSRSRAWVTFDLPDAVSQLNGERLYAAAHPTTRNIPNLLRNAILGLRVLHQEKPDLIVSTGAGVAVPFFVLGRALGIPTVYVEVYDRVNSATLTGRMCRPFTTLFLVQWESQLSLYRGSVLLGRLL